MRLTIDTTTDSKDDLRRVIRFLQLFVNGREFRSDLPKLDDAGALDTQAQAAAASSSAALGQFFDTINNTSTSAPAPKPETTKPEQEFKIDFF